MTAQEQHNFVHYEDQVPFDWLFARVKAIVNHGGSGTLAFGLRAGKPSIVCAFTPEQTFWGYQINRLNAGPPPLHQIPREDFTAERLSEAIKLAVNDPTILKGAKDLGKAIRNEDGLGNAVKFIHTQIVAFSNRKINQ